MGLSGFATEKQRKKYIKRMAKEKKRVQFLMKLKEQAKMAEGKVCRICLGEENNSEDPLISPCKCSGTMSHIHLSCLREWLNSKRSRKEHEYVKTYCWKIMECELCKVRFPA
mmetsp:Transcript_32786/g.50047  ORF Transcript_32786/g.50047 Transcript_32786/m.50047 type:complete len:112 (-) Transcript_32786:1221-1556(-)